MITFFCNEDYIFYDVLVCKSNIIKSKSYQPKQSRKLSLIHFNIEARYDLIKLAENFREIFNLFQPISKSA